jgi:hypothetical protein
MTEKEAIVLNLPQSKLGGVQTPRIHSKLTDLPSKGQEMIDFASSTWYRAHGMAKVCRDTWS